MAKRSTNPTSAQAVELLVQTLSRHSSLSSGDERAMRKLLHPRVSKVTRGADIVRQGDHPHVAVVVISGMLARYHPQCEATDNFPLSQTQIGQVVGLSIATVNRATQTLRYLSLVESATCPTSNRSFLG
jgi:CRP-like cAMP-binding protein